MSFYECLLCEGITGPGEILENYIHFAKQLLIEFLYRLKI